jgi:hypothetical protein
MQGIGLVQVLILAQRGDWPGCDQALKVGLLDSSHSAGFFFVSLL